MATQLLKTVKPSGGDYTSLEACMNANEKDLTSSDEYFDVEIDGTWSSADTSAVTIHNYTTDATRYINIYTTSACRHPGYFSDSSPYYRIDPSTNNSIVFDVQSDYVTVTGIQVTNEGYNAGSDISLFYFQSSDNCELSKSILANGVNTAAPTKHTIGLSYYSAAGESNTASNCVVSGNDGSGVNFYSSSGSSNIYNSVSAANGNVGISSGLGTLVATNCYSGGNTGDDYGGAGTITQTTCASSDTTATGTSLDSIAYSTSSGAYFTNVTSGSEDFHITNTSSDLYQAGTDLSGTFTDDIDGDTRSSWDIGIDYITTADVSAEATPTSVYITSSTNTAQASFQRSDLASASIFYLTISAGFPIFLQQEGFRWRDDDNDEANASWLDAQDTNISRERNVNTRIRVLVNANGDPASKQFQLEYRKVGDTDWKAVPTE